MPRDILDVGRGIVDIDQGIDAVERGIADVERGIDDVERGIAEAERGIADVGQAAAATSVTAEQLANRDTRTTEREKIAAANLKKVADAGIPIAMGTDAGNPLTLHGPSVYAEMEAMQAAGLTPMQVLVAATRGGALAQGREKELGTIEKGKLADLLILNADSTKNTSAFRQVRAVVRCGVLRSIEELSALVTTAGE